MPMASITSKPSIKMVVLRLFTAILFLHLFLIFYSLNQVDYCSFTITQCFSVYSRYESLNSVITGTEAMESEILPGRL